MPSVKICWQYASTTSRASSARSTPMASRAVEVGYLDALFPVGRENPLRRHLSYDAWGKRCRGVSRKLSAMRSTLSASAVKSNSSRIMEVTSR